MPKPAASAIAVAVVAATNETSPEPFAVTTALSPRYAFSTGFDVVVSLTIEKSTASETPSELEVASG
jgi:hypothetical protein